MFGIIRPLPVYLQGLGQDTTVQDWIGDVMKPIADVVKEYYDLQYQQQGVQAQKVVQATPFPSISPIYLIVGGLVVWWLFKGSKKGQKRREGGR